MGVKLVFPILHQNGRVIKTGAPIRIPEDFCDPKYIDTEKCVIVNERDNMYSDNIVLCKDDPIVDTVVKKFLYRSTQGMKKYNTSMDANKAPTLEWINHAQEEAMDFILYLERLKKDVNDMREKLNAGWGM